MLAVLVYGCASRGKLAPARLAQTRFTTGLGIIFGLRPFVLQSTPESETFFYFQVSSDLTAEEPWIGPRAMRGRQPRLVVASLQAVPWDE